MTETLVEFREQALAMVNNGPQIGAAQWVKYARGDRLKEKAKMAKENSSCHTPRTRMNNEIRKNKGKPQSHVCAKLY